MTSYKTSFCSLGIAPPYRPAGAASSNRLSRGFLRLEDIGRRRDRGNSSVIRRSIDTLAENWILWRELLELEFHALLRKGPR